MLRHFGDAPADPKVDAWQKDDVYFRYSDATIGETIRAISFDPRAW